MRFYAVGSLVLLLAGCGAKYKPVGPVMNGYERSFLYPVHRPHEGLTYNGRAPATTAPVLPLMAFGAAFDLDLVVMPKNSDFDMLEFARVSFPDRYVWVALETSAASGDQTLLANLDDIESFMPELPLARQSVNLQADDRSTEFTVDVSLSYPNSRGQKLEAEITGDPPSKTAKKRNGKTFNHSANQLMAVLDVAASESLFKADVKLDGKGVPFRKVAGIVPGQFVLQQAQGGLAAGNFTIEPTTPAVGGASFGEVAVSGAAAPAAEPAPTKPPPELQVRMAVAKNFASVQECYTKRLAEKADVKGRMQFDFKVDAGKVSAPTVAKIEAPDALVDEALGACVVAAIGTWSFDASVTGTVSWPFTFEPGVAAAEGVEAVEPMVKIGEGAVDLVEPPAPEVPATDEKLGDEDLIGDLGDEDPDASTATRPEEMGAATLSSFSTTHKMQSGAEVELQWLVSRTGDRVEATQTTELRTLTYDYRIVQDNFLELVGITVEQYGRATPVTAITFNPPIPDVRWPFNGRRNSSFVVDVNGQQNYATGEVEAYWTESGPKIKVVPSAPEWVAERPLLTSITFQDGAAAIKIERTGE